MDQDAIAPYAPHFTRPLGDVAADLEFYAQLLAKWQPVQNLVSRETLAMRWVTDRGLLVARLGPALLGIGERDLAGIGGPGP